MKNDSALESETKSGTIKTVERNYENVEHSKFQDFQNIEEEIHIDGTDTNTSERGKPTP